MGARAAARSQVALAAPLAKRVKDAVDQRQVVHRPLHRYIRLAAVGRQVSERRHPDDGVLGFGRDEGVVQHKASQPDRTLWPIALLPDLVGDLPELVLKARVCLEDGGDGRRLGDRHRSALEMLLHQEGYEKGMLHQKITDLLADGSPPTWRDDIDSAYLDALKQIGNVAIHPNDGDITKQAALDRELLVALRAVFSELLDTIYERPVIEAARKAQLTGAVQSFKSAPPAQAPPQASPPATAP